MRIIVTPSRCGVRTRSAAVAMLVVFVTFAAAAVVLTLLLRASLQRSVDAATEIRAAQIASALASTPGPAQLGSGLLSLTDQVDAVQVIDAAGHVVAGSDDAPSNALLTRSQSGRGAFLVTGREDGEVTRYRAVAQTAGQQLVVVASEQQPITDAASTVELLLALALPALVLVVGAATHLLVGRSLRPVDRMRTRAAEITTADLSDRLPVPASRDEIGRLAVTLNTMLARLEAGAVAQRRFVGDASHELRSPLSTLTAALELGLTRPDQLDQTLISTALLPEARRMQRLVDDLLLLAKVDERGLPLRVHDVDVEELLAAERLRLRSQGTVSVSSIAEPVQIRGDQDQLARALRNLVDNAARHATTRVEMTCRREGDAVVVGVADDGPGIDPAERDRVFARFVRLDSGRTRAAGGSGLGLSIVAEIVAAHGGTVGVDASPSGGALFVVRLPVAGPRGGRRPSR